MILFFVILGNKKITFFNHHECHAASAFFTSPFKNADILTIYNGDSVDAEEFGMFSGNFSNGPGFISADNPSGCLTFYWISNNSAHTTGWEASISCFEPCQEISGTIENTNPQPDEEGRILLCPGDEVEFFGSGEFSVSGENATYSWDFGDGNSAQGQNVSHIFEESGIYSVGLTINDDNPGYHVTLGCAYSAKEDYESSVSAFKSAIKIIPRSVSETLLKKCLSIQFFTHTKLLMYSSFLISLLYPGPPPALDHHS